VGLTTILEAKNQIKKHFEDRWNNRTPIYWDNETTETVKKNIPWVRGSIRLAVGGQQTLGSPGNRMFNRYGYLIFQVFIPSNQKTQISDELVQAILDIFDGAEVGDVNIIKGSPTFVNFEKAWYQQNVQFNISFSEFK
jgi:hypothetical protein